MKKYIGFIIVGVVFLVCGVCLGSLVYLGKRQLEKEDVARKAAEKARIEAAAKQKAAWEAITPSEHLQFVLKDPLSSDSNRHLSALKVGSAERNQAEAAIASAKKAQEREKVAALIRNYGEKVYRIHDKHPSWDWDTCTTISQGKVHIGMTQEQCLAAWGRPYHINNTTYSFGTHSQWCYGEYCNNALYFENGILTTIQN